MGRAHEVRKVAMAKNCCSKSKNYILVMEKKSI